ncbi:10217_t:CDS:2, partial [Racocetra persica]
DHIVIDKPSSIPVHPSGRYGWKYESELPFWATDKFVGDMEYV